LIWQLTSHQLTSLAAIDYSIYQGLDDKRPTTTKENGED